NLLCQPAGAERRSQREGGVAILQFRGAGQAPGGFRDAIALWAGQSRGARADAAGAAASDAGLAGERKDSLQARRRLDRAAARSAAGALDPVAHDVTWGETTIAVARAMSSIEHVRSVGQRGRIK